MQKTIVTLYRGMSKEEYNNNLNYNFTDLSWWSDDPKDASAFSKGIIQKIEVEINENIIGDFIHQVNIENKLKKDYSFGKISIYHTTTTWYSFSSNYLRQHIKKFEEYIHIEEEIIYQTTIDLFKQLEKYRKN